MTLFHKHEAQLLENMEIGHCFQHLIQKKLKTINSVEKNP